MNTNNYVSTREREEDSKRFDAAAARLVERTRNNKEAATDFLREVGYFDLMSDEQREHGQPVNGSAHLK